MNFYEELQTQTRHERANLFSAPVIAAAIHRKVNRDQYLDFLTRAFHHVKHTVPLLMACGARLPDDLEWLRTAVAHYIDEELGHHEWILNDITVVGGDGARVRLSAADQDTEVLVAYAYDTVMRRNPVGLFGMVYVLEGTSVALASEAAEALQSGLGLPKNAFSYLSTHGSLDKEHLGDFEALMNRLERPADRAAVVDGAKVFYRLYGNVLRGITDGAAQ